MSRTPQTTDDNAAHTYDAFLSYHPQDRWALEWLLPRLEAAGLTVCIDRRDFTIGLPKVVNREQAVEQSRHTLLILTPRWLAGEWAAFEASLVQSSDPAGLQRRLIPVLLERSTLPARIAQLEAADFTDQTGWDDELARLVRNLGGDVIRARTLAGELPLDWVPEPAPLPRPHRMPLKRNPLFVGRDEELKALAAVLNQHGSTAAITTGIGGVGKTQLAAEFAHRYGQFFPGGVFWLSFAEPAGIDAEIAACGGAGAMELYSDADGLTLAEQVRRVYAAWEQETVCLLIFDNCDDTPAVSAADLLTKYLPSGGRSRVLVTSRRGQWPRSLGLTAHALGILPREESMALLRGHRDDLRDADASAIAVELGDLPLALTLAGSYLDTYRDESFGVPATYLAALRKSLLAHRSLKGAGAGPSLTGHELNVYATIDLSYQRLDTTDPTDALATAALARAACLAPGEPFPRDLLLATLYNNEADTGEEEAAVRRSDAVGRLVALGLLETSAAGMLRIHRLIAAFARDTVADSDPLAAIEQVLNGTGYDLLNQGLPASFLPIQPHLRHLVNLALTRADSRASDLCTIMTRYLRLVGDSTGALPYALRALAINEAASDDDQHNIIASLNDVALLLQAQGDYAAAQPLFERALSISEQALGPEHPSTAANLNNLAVLLKDQGDYAAARPLFERALAIREQTLGPEHPDTAQGLSNLAMLLQDQGDYAAARPLFERALQVTEQVFGPEHPSSAIRLNNLASVLQDQGDYAAARPLFERALAIREQTLGPEHPDTAQCLNNLASLLQAQGDYEAARPLLEHALQVAEQVLGPEHHNTAIILNNLAMLLKDQGDYEAARPLLEHALQVTEQVLGPEHPRTAIRLNNLAMLLQAQGDYAAARPLFERALAIREQTLGPEHPLTHSSWTNLAALDRRRQTREEQIAEITAHFEAAVAETLANPSSDRSTLIGQLKDRARWAEEGEQEGSPYLALARHLQALAAQLIEPPTA